MIISTKIGQTSFVNENGTRVSATVLDYNSCSVVGNRTIDRDGYLANIIGFLKPKKLNKPQLKQFNKLNLEPKKIIKEQRIRSNKKLYENDINPVFRCLEENYLGKETPKLNVVFFDIEVDFDPERGYATTDDPFMPITAISCYLSWTDQLVTLAKIPNIAPETHQ